VDELTPRPVVAVAPLVELFAVFRFEFRVQQTRHQLFFAVREFAFHSVFAERV
jgi:hypothetical protein